MKYKKASHFLVRLGVAFAFLYPAIREIYDPYSWVGYFPSFMRGYVPDLVLLHSFGALEVVIALWILSGKKIFLPSLAATGILLLIVGFDFQELDVVFRDLSIAAAALALALGAL